tara:strand:- start:2159 stop:2542 length:384 start_codon:yes stop_codon:yes gene_type:complete
MEQNYLVSFALLQQNGIRFMPLGGKSLKSNGNDLDISLAKEVLAELLLRVFERSKQADISSFLNDASLAIVEISFENMNSRLPEIKSEWINSGNIDKLILDLSSISKTIWTASFVRYEGISFKKLKL